MLSHISHCLHHQLHQPLPRSLKIYLANSPFFKNSHRVLPTPHNYRLFKKIFKLNKQKTFQTSTKNALMNTL